MLVFAVFQQLHSSQIPPPHWAWHEYVPNGLWQGFYYYTPAKRICCRVYWFHSFCQSVCPSNCPSRIPCPLCGSYSSGWIHFIFIHLIKQFQNVCHVWRFLQNLNFWQFFLICNFDFVLFWLGIWCELLVWVIMGRRGVLYISGHRHSTLGYVIDNQACLFFQHWKMLRGTFIVVQEHLFLRLQEIIINKISELGIPVKTTVQIVRASFPAS